MSTEPVMNAHPDAETLAAFAEGRLAAPRRAEVTEHVATCGDCVTELALAMGTAGREATVNRRPFAARRGLLAAAAVIAIVSALVLAYFATQRARRGSIEQLVALAPHAARAVEPRLTGGFAWAAYRGSARSHGETMDAERMRLTGAAGELVDRASHDNSADAQHAAGVAMVLIEQPTSAIRHLENAARANDARTWSDLAAARYAAAADLQRASLYPEALAAADRALHIDPSLPEALFNRALILERMRLTAEARRAWTRYLEVDSSSPWAAEARKRLGELPATTSTWRFERDRPALEDAAARGDAAATRALVSHHTDRARAFAETEYLGQWGEAFARGDAAEETRTLTMARTIGDALVSISGEPLVHDAVAAIDRASAADRLAIARTHALYRRARIALSRFQFADARRDLLAAAAQFENDPMALPARYYAAVARLSSNDVQGARAELEQLRASVDARYVSLGAHIRWELGRAHRLDDDPAEAIAMFTEAAALFRRGGDRASEAFVEGMLASALATVGRGDDAWTARIRAFDALSAEGDRDLLAASVGSARKEELLDGRRDVALALSRLENPSANARPVDAIDSLLHRALLEAEAGNDADAMRSAREAQMAAARIADPALRAREEAEAAFAMGAALSVREPRAAIASLTHAIDFYRAHDMPFALPEPLLLRARSATRNGDNASAARDLDDATSACRADTPVCAEVFENAIRLALDRNDRAAAFAIAERTHGATFTLAELQRRLAGSGVAVLEVVALPDEVVTFAVSSNDVSVSRRARKREELAALANDSLSENGTRAAAALYDDVIRPVDAIVASARELIVIPDRALQTAPFAAFYDAATRRHLVERLPVAIAASAASLERKPQPPLASIVAVALPSGAQTDTKGLPATSAELDDISAIYRRTVILEPSFAALRDADADVIHIAGHTAEQPGGGDRALLFGMERVSWKRIAASPLPRAEIVVLAACETLRPPASSLTRAPSLGAAFSAAGTRDVIGTLAIIADGDARVLFRAMHRELAAGASAADAVRAAQLQAIRGDGPRAWRTVALFTRRIRATPHEMERA